MTNTEQWWRDPWWREQRAEATKRRAWWRDPWWREQASAEVTKRHRKARPQALTTIITWLRLRRWFG